MFAKCKDLEEAKKLFRKLAMKLHPDYGRTNELMILLQETYEICVEKLTPSTVKVKPKPKIKTTKCEFYENSFEDIYNGDTRLFIIPEIIKYAQSHKSFKTSYLESVMDFLNQNEFVTSGQYNPLVKIYYAFRMDEKNKEQETTNTTKEL